MALPNEPSWLVVTMTLPGLRSPWTSPCWWMAATPEAHVVRDAPELVGRVAALSLLAADVRVERLAGDVLHHEDRAVRARRQVVHAADVRVADRAREEQLLPQRLVVAGHARLFAHDLQGDGLLRRPVVREKDLAHPALAEALTNFVAVVDDRPVRQRRQAAPARLRHSRLDTASLPNIIPRRRPRPRAARAAQGRARPSCHGFQGCARSRLQALTSAQGPPCPASRRGERARLRQRGRLPALPVCPYNACPCPVRDGAPARARDWETPRRVARRGSRGPRRACRPPCRRPAPCRGDPRRSPRRSARSP